MLLYGGVDVQEEMGVAVPIAFEKFGWIRDMKTVAERNVEKRACFWQF